MIRKQLVALGAGAALASIAGAQDLHLNEIYASHSGLDDREFIELIGDPGLSLDNHVVLIVEGEGGGAGTLDRVWDLTGFTVPADGFFLMGDTAVPGIDFDLGLDNRIENGDETIYLVDAGSETGVNDFLFLLNQSVEVAPATTVIPMMGTVLDLVGMSAGEFGDVIYDGAPVIGPDGIFFPAGIYRGEDYPNDWCEELFLDFDPDVNLDVPRTPGAPNVECNTDSLTVDTTSISLSAGGSQNFSLDAGVDNASAFWWIFGSVTGTSPGVDLGGGITLPVNFDPYFNLTLSKPFLGIFQNFIGILDANGQGAAALNLPAGADPSLAGLTLFHAFAAAEVLGVTEFASNAVTVTLDA